MKVLITGSEGYIGKHLQYSFSTMKDVTVVPFDLKLGNDIREISHINRVFTQEELKGDSIDAVIHLAALISVEEGESNPEDYINTNVVGTMNLLFVMKTNKCKRFIFASTAAVYETNDKLLHEESKLKPKSMYGRTKRMCERSIIEMCPTWECKYTIYRFFNVCGSEPTIHVKDQNSHLFPNLVNNIINDMPMRIYGTDYETPDGTCIRDYVHVMDICDALVLLGKENSYNQIFNLGSNKGYSVKDIVKEFVKVGERYYGRAKVCYMKSRKGDCATLVADSKKANDLLSWMPKRSLTTMISSSFFISINDIYE